jgi:hypothetical protein
LEIQERDVAAATVGAALKKAGAATTAPSDGTPCAVDPCCAEAPPAPERRAEIVAGDEGGRPRRARSSRRSDAAFQRAMHRAVAEGRERPPRIGVFKDDRRLTAPRLYEPAPHSSGGTSPALECAESEKFADYNWTWRLFEPDGKMKEEP